MDTSVQATAPPSPLDLARAGDQSAFGQVIRRHQSMVYSIALRYLRNTASAEELSQEVFLHLYRSLDAIASEAHLESWLRRVTVHRAIDQTRRLRYRPKLGLDQAPPAIARGAQEDPLLRQWLRQLVDALPDRARMMVILRYQEDLNPAEIAEMLGVPIGTVKSGLHRALSVLREKCVRLGGFE